ncbi:MAG: hypothetical protein MMC33_006003 [Icmadophila ericetorum]|nr:hypothetical protein [Icmadophila ericetorum]
MSSQKRIQRELSDLEKQPLAGYTITPSDQNIHEWKILLAGPPSTPFSSGTFHLQLSLPSDYPFKPPVIKFVTKIYHPNVDSDKGAMCLGLLRPEEWKPSTRVRDVLEFAKRLLVEPQGDDAVEAGIGREFKEERGKWEKTAREWTNKYATGEEKKGKK